MVIPPTYTKFTASDDGYLTLFLTDDSGSARIGLNTIGTILLDCPKATYNFDSLFLRKGTSVYLIGDGTYGCYFFSPYVE